MSLKPMSLKPTSLKSMSLIPAPIASRLAVADDVGSRGLARLAPVVVFQLAALAVMAWSEIGPLAMAVFVLAWGFVNFVFLAMLRRPGLSSALSFMLLTSLIAASRFKFQVVGMTASFVDVMVIDAGTISFVMSILPEVRSALIAGALAVLPLAVMIWRIDRLRLRRSVALAGASACLAGLAGLSLAVPINPGEAFGNENYLSGFARSGVAAVVAYATHGFLEADASADGQFGLATDASCTAAGPRPHIILLHDESSFDIRDGHGVKVPQGYGRHFLSFDGKERRFLVEGAGGPSWLTEYNVLAGLSSRSYGPFQFFVTRIAAGRVVRGLPHDLVRCGYRTYSIFPANGAFLGARSFHTGVGVQDFVDGKETGANVFEPDRFYFDQAARRIEHERAGGPMFLYVYLTANHFPFDSVSFPQYTPEDWSSPGNAAAEVDEYLRRQAMSERDYADFIARLKRDFPHDAFLIVRYGDHQPDFARLVLDEAADAGDVSQSLMELDPRYFTTYYAIDAVNFAPVDVSSALDTLDAPYLPLVVQEAAGLPLSPSFAEQKRILERCHGLFYGCAGGAEARRFNRLLIDAGLIKGL